MKKILLLMAIVLPFVLISCGDDKDEPESPDNHEWIDLGLPSGTLWATCNIGANKPEEYGDYFAWGEVSSKKVYSNDNYKWSDYSKYNETDNKTELEPEDDAAYVNWGITGVCLRLSSLVSCSTHALFSGRSAMA